MLVLLSWLREYAPEIDGDPAWLGEQLSDLGLAVEEMSVLGEGLEGVVVARVLATRPHPKADRIQLVDVDAGDGEALQICCGAFNMAPGDLVPLATLGTTMANGMVIERRKLRGEWSNGMLCAADEIGLGSDHDGILVLPPGLTPGVPLAEALGIERDVLYDLEVNPNRPDALSVVGVARDLAARLRVPFSPPAPEVPTSGPDATGLVSVEIQDPQLCGRFVVRVLEKVTIGTSPPWLANRLTALGMRPINSVVDISNYVMLELGQPNHTFDLAEVVDGRLIVRRARPGETLVTLDGVERRLAPGDGVIAGGDDVVVSLAGVMGGASTEISERTRQVLVEMAWWDPPSIARTSRRLALRSEASARFERTVDPEIAELAMLRFAELAAGSGATLCPGVVDERGELPPRSRVRVRTRRVNELLGTSLSPERIRELLEPIGFASTPAGEDHDVTVPSFRPDSSTEIDVVEEVARMEGYSALPRTVPAHARAGSLTRRQLDRRRLRQLLVGLGATEAMPLPFLAPGDTARAGLSATAITITNPLVAEESVMRPSLRPGLLRAAAYNSSHRNGGVSLFEIGKVWGPVPPGADLPDEREVLGLALAGREAPAAVEALYLLVEGLGFSEPELDQRLVEGLHATRGAQVVVEGRLVGAVGEIAPEVLDAFEVPERVAWLELDLTTLLDLPHGEAQLVAFSRYPSSDVDLAFEIGEEVPAAAVRSTLRKAGGALVVGCELFDVYRGQRVSDGTRSLAFRLRFQADDRTLTSAEVEGARQACIDAVVAAHDGVLRA